MAVAVLERKVNTEESGYTKDVFRETFMTPEEKHNARIGDNYAKLINPDSKPRDIIGNNSASARVENIVETPVQNAVQETPYLVTNARADSDIFRAESAVNRKYVEVAETSVAEDEEENEDLVPTKTTIQYKTASLKKTEEEGKVSTKSEVKKAGFTKKDKIIIAVALTVIIALFVLIIVNSAVISGLNSELSTLQNTLNSVENTYTESLSAKESYLSETNLYQIVSEFARNNGMILK